MEANLNYNRLRLRDTSRNVTIPNNDVARLMYYLDCVSTVLNYKGFGLYTDYHNFYRLSGQNMIELLELINKFNIEVLMDVGVFIKTDVLDMNNRFIQIIDETMKIHTNQEIVIGGIVTRALKVMLFKPDWAIFFYYNPKQRLNQRLYPPLPIYQPLPPYPIYPPYQNNQYYTNNDEELCCCTIF